MATAVTKSRARPAEAHAEWWSPQQALTMILTGDEAAADAAASQTFADFEEEMKRRELAAWIGEATDELYGAIRTGAPMVERESDAPSGLPCPVRGLRLGENVVNVISPDDIRDPARSAAWRLVLRRDEFVLGANGHIEWRSLEFERAGVLRAARWACRDGWLETRMADIDELVIKYELSMLSSVHLLMMKMRQDGRRLAAIVDEDFPQADLVPTRMQNPRWSKRPPLWLMRQEPQTAEETWNAAHEIFDEARSLLLKALKDGSVEAVAKDEDRGQIISNHQFKLSKIYIFSSTIANISNISIERSKLDKVKCVSHAQKAISTSAQRVQLRKRLAGLLRQAGENADDRPRS